MADTYVSQAKIVDRRRTVVRRLKKKPPPRKQKPLKQLEVESREKGLNEPIPETNKGFKLLEKMGYKKGMGLGRQGTGIIDPLSLEIKTSKTGLGKDDFKKKQEELFKIRNKLIDKQKETQRRKVELSYNDRMRSKFEDKKSISHVTQLISISKQLDIQENKSDNPLMVEFDELEKEDNPISLREYLEVMEPEVRAKKLIDFLEYLRSTYKYCYFCGTKYDSQEELNEKCPGLLEDVHDV
eukprot:TRINITY_DN6502_c0_g1_i1.p1 TRINITY_DN6502_c0_g1~~TRINITY_DN6502_c0_g1_i1.p1  ORF type:complete len:253 (+),score=55.27 TRINITY_DN6502_c0_g1_i1:41-760(+)